MKKFGLFVAMGVALCAGVANAQTTTIVDTENEVAVVADGDGNVAVADADGNSVVKDADGNTHIEDADGNTVSLDSDGIVTSADVTDDDGNRVVVQ